MSAARGRTAPALRLVRRASALCFVATLLGVVLLAQATALRPTPTSTDKHGVIEGLTHDAMPGSYGYAFYLDLRFPLDVAKHRNGETGVATLRFDRATTRFSSPRGDTVPAGY